MGQSTPPNRLPPTPINGKDVGVLTREPMLKQIRDEIKEVSKRLAQLQGEREAIDTELGLSTRIVSLEREKTKKEIELDRVNETHAREKREIEHMVGLHRKRVDQEIELAKREQTLTVREENLKADRERFEQQMQFMQTRMETELDRLNGLTSEILERLPKFNVDWSNERVGANGGGK